MKCKEFKNNVYILFTDDKVPAAMQQHLLSCEKCQKIVAEIKEVSPKSLYSINEEPSPFFASKCEAALENILEVQELRTPVFASLKPVLITIGLLLALGSGILFGRHYASNNVNMTTQEENGYTETLSLSNYQNYYLSE